MRVVFDMATARFTPGGVYTYIYHLAAALARYGAAYGDTLLLADLPAYLRPDSSRGLQHKWKVLAWDSYYKFLLLPAGTSAAGADLLHTEIRLPLRARVPVVTTIYDVMALLFPHLYRFRDRLTLRLYLRVGCRTADHIVTISEQSRQDIHRQLGVALERISVTGNGVASLFRPVSEAQRQPVLARYGVTTPYLLAVGVRRPNKNLERLLRAFALLKRHYAIPHNLVLVGAGTWNEPAFLNTLKHADVRDAVRLTGFVPEADLPALYSGATALVFPSLYEGFGMPLLEAMACGCPIVTSNRAAMPEVVGDAGLLVDPYSVEAIAEMVLQVIADPALAEVLREKGRKRARWFSWERCAAQTWQTYQRVLNQAKQQ